MCEGLEWGLRVRCVLGVRQASMRWLALRRLGCDCRVLGGMVGEKCARKMEVRSSILVEIQVSWVGFAVGGVGEWVRLRDILSTVRA